MCGFAGIISLTENPLDAKALERMGAVLAHRGPDDVSTYLGDRVGFVFRRLSILDVSDCARQPMHSDDSSQVLVFNGEIYNYLELRRELAALGHRFHSTGDTEVLLAAYRQWGTDCVQRFNGMWAFLIHDRQRGVVFGSRDRMGVKPLFRYRTTTDLYLASEIKAIRAAGSYRGGLNWERAAAFLLVGRADQLPEDRSTFHAGVEQVPAGTAFEVASNGRIREWRYWSVSTDIRISTGDPAPPDRFAELLMDSVHLRLRSDVPVGVSLSGGLDSSSVMSLMATALGGSAEDVREQPLRAFCYMSPDFDESTYIRDTLAQTGAELHPVEIDPLRIWRGLDSFVWHQDEPVHSMTGMVGYEVYRTAAAAGVKVVLGGQGADETAAGYPNYFVEYWKELLNTGHLLRLAHEVNAYAGAHGGSPRQLLRSAVLNALGTWLRLFAPYRRRVQARTMRRLHSNSWYTEVIKRHLTPPADSSGSKLNDILRWSVELAPLPLYLRVEDRNSMAHSVEARLPFMDYRLVEYVFSLAAGWKLRGPLNKYVMREGMRGHIPESVRTRVDKMGFPSSARRWFAGPLYEPMQDLLASQATRERGIYEVARIRADLDRHRRGEVDVSSALFNVAQLESWAALDARDWRESSE